MDFALGAARPFRVLFCLCIFVVCVLFFVVSVCDVHVYYLRVCFSCLCVFFCVSICVFLCVKCVLFRVFPRRPSSPPPKKIKQTSQIPPNDSRPAGRGRVRPRQPDGGHFPGSRRAGRCTCRPVGSTLFVCLFLLCCFLLCVYVYLCCMTVFMFVCLLAISTWSPTGGWRWSCRPSRSRAVAAAVAAHRGTARPTAARPSRRQPTPQLHPASVTLICGLSASCMLTCKVDMHIAVNGGPTCTIGMYVKELRGAAAGRQQRRGGGGSAAPLLPQTAPPCRPSAIFAPLLPLCYFPPNNRR